MRQNDSGRAKVLSVVPIMDGVGAGCPLSVTVNGQPVKALCGSAVDMASANSRDIFIPGQLWVADANGDVTVELTRQAPVSGTLALDALTLSGSWQVGTVGNGADEFCHERYCPDVFFVEDADVTNHVRKATYPSSSSSPSGLFLRSWLPKQAAETCKARFAMRIANTPPGNDFLFKVLVGDSVVWSGTVVKGDTIAFEIPCRTFSSGYNDVSVQNCSTEDTFWAQYDYFRLDLKPISGMYMIFR